jgi:hypothetical protein
MREELGTLHGAWKKSYRTEPRCASLTRSNHWLFRTDLISRPHSFWSDDVQVLRGAHHIQNRPGVNHDEGSILHTTFGYACFGRILEPMLVEVVEVAVTH